LSFGITKEIDTEFESFADYAEYFEPILYHVNNRPGLEPFTGIDLKPCLTSQDAGYVDYTSKELLCADFSGHDLSTFGDFRGVPGQAESAYIVFGIRLLEKKIDPSLLAQIRIVAFGSTGALDQDAVFDKPITSIVQPIVSMSISTYADRYFVSKIRGNDVIV